MKEIKIQVEKLTHLRAMADETGIEIKENPPKDFPPYIDKVWQLIGYIDAITYGIE